MKVGSPESITDEVMDVFTQRGSEAYFGEAVTQLEHALQAAHLAVQAGASDALVVAALLHDIGHLLHSGGEDVAERGIDTRHERIGARWLSPRFGVAVSEPVRLHVAAKRYLCHTDPAYFARLSPASVQSLELQGGPMGIGESRQFERQDHWQEAVALRHWDEEAKVVGLAVPSLESYRARLIACARSVADDPSLKSVPGRARPAHVGRP